MDNNDKKENALKAAMALNLCTTSISKIISAQDINIMRHEYDYILNNINFEKIIKDEALLSTMKSILDTLSFYLIQHQDRQILARRYQHKMNNAIWDSVMGVPNTVVVSFSTPVTALISAAVSGAISIGSAYVNYRRSKSNTELERMEEEWKLERAALEQLHGLRLSLFETAWRLFANYEIPDEHRLSVKQVDLYNGLLMEPNPQWRYQKLDMVKDYFNAYPYFWYELSEAAYQVYISDKGDLKHYLKKAEEAINKFFEIINGKELLRQDVIYASAIVRKIQILQESSNSWSKAIKEVAAYVGGIPQLESFYRKLAADSPDLLMNAAMIFMVAYSELKYPEHEPNDQCNQCCNQCAQRDQCDQQQYAASGKRLFWMLVNQGYNVPMTTRMLSWLDLDTNDDEDYDLLRTLVSSHSNRENEIKILCENNRERDNQKDNKELPTRDLMILPKGTKTEKEFLTKDKRREDTISELMQISGTMFDVSLKKACPIFNTQSNAVIALSNFFKEKEIISAGNAQGEIEKWIPKIYVELNVQCLIWQDTWDIDFLTMQNAISHLKKRVGDILPKVGSKEKSPYMQAEAVGRMIAVFRAYFISLLTFKTLINERRSSTYDEFWEQNIKYFNDHIYDLRCKISQFQEEYFISNITTPTTLMDYSIDYFSGNQNITAQGWKYETDKKKEALLKFIKSRQDITVDGVSFKKNEMNAQLADLLKTMKDQKLSVLVYNLGAPIPPEAIQENAYPFWSRVVYIWNYVFNCRNTRTFRRQYNHADYRVALYPSKIVAHFNPNKE